MKTLFRTAACAVVDRWLRLSLSLILLCSLPTAALAASDSNLPVQATLSNFYDEPVVYSSTWSDCSADDNVVVGLRIFYDGTYSRRQFRCAEVRLKGQKPVFITERISALEDFYGMLSPLIPPENFLVKKLRLPVSQDAPLDPVKSEIQIAWARLTIDDAPLNLRPDGNLHLLNLGGEWTTCPQDMVLVAYRMRYVMCGTLWTGNAPSTSPPGRISFRKTEEDTTNCSIGVPNGPTGEVWTSFFGSYWSTCNANIHEGIALQYMPSATRIFLADDRWCRKDEEWGDNKFWIELRITRDKTSMDFLPFDEFFTYDKGSIVRPGVQLVDYHREGSESASAKLSCVRVTTSSAPPSS